MLNSDLSNLLHTFHIISRQADIALMSEELSLWLMRSPKGLVITGITFNTER